MGVQKIPYIRSFWIWTMRNGFLINKWWQENQPKNPPEVYSNIAPENYYQNPIIGKKVVFLSHHFFRGENVKLRRGNKHVFVEALSPDRGGLADLFFFCSLVSDCYMNLPPPKQKNGRWNRKWKSAKEHLLQKPAQEVAKLWHINLAMEHHRVQYGKHMEIYTS